MAADMDTTGEDTAEIARLLSLTANPRVRQILTKALQELSSSCPVGHAEAKRPRTTDSMPMDDAPPTQLPKPTSTAPAEKGMSYQSIDTFSWEQTHDEVKVLIPLDGVAKDMVTPNFTANSFDIKVEGLNGRNYRCSVHPLNQAVVPEGCSIFVPKSQKRVVVKLKKASTSMYNEKNWSELKKKNDTLGTSKKKESSNPDDPSAGLMDLMKNLYNDGDDDMKRTIAKAWTEAQSGKQPDPPEMPDLPMPSMSDMPDMKGFGDMKL